MFAAVVVDEGTLVAPDDPGADWWFLDDPLGDAWWDPAESGEQPAVEVDADVEATLAPRLSVVTVGPEVERLLADAGVEVRREIERLAGAAGVGPRGEVEASPAPWLSAACLEAVIPGAGLAGVLKRVDLPSADDELVVEFVAASQKLAAWSHLIAAEAAAELSRRASMNPDWRAPVPTRTCVAGDELAMRLGWSRPAANRLVRDGQALNNELLLTAEAVREGRLDSAKLRVLTDRLHDRPGQLAWAVQEQVLPQAATRTPTQLAADVDRALLAVDPEDAAFRLPTAVASRHVCHPRRLPDGMAGLWAVLPAVDAARIDATLEATARAARALGDPRTLDQLRADTLTDLATGTALLAGTKMAADGATASRVAGQATVDRSAAVEALGMRDADLPDGLLAVTTIDPHTIRPSAQDRDDASSRDDAVAAKAGKRSSDEDRPPGRQAPGIRVPRVRIDVTVALSTLLGLDDQPGELAGLGPIPAEQARALAAGGIWRRLVTDPLTGAVLDVGRTRYKPPQPMAEHVLARDGVCAAPGCSVPAHRCDLDHTTEYHDRPANGSPEQGTTSADNLGPLSHHCHRLKTDGGFTLTQVAPGVFEWHTPAGYTYRVTPGDFGRTERTTKRSLPEDPPF
jgi:hypothetical protein